MKQRSWPKQPNIPEPPKPRPPEPWEPPKVPRSPEPPKPPTPKMRSTPCFPQNNAPLHAAILRKPLEQPRSAGRLRGCRSEFAKPSVKKEPKPLVGNGRVRDAAA